MKLPVSWEWEIPPTLVLPLAVLAVGYRSFLGVRGVLYTSGVLKSRRLPCRVISIGNLTLGGTGKTPAVELAVKTLQRSGIESAVVSRGYGRRTRGPLVVADRNRIRVEPAQAGDEPFLLARRLPGTPVVVGEDRYEAGRLCLERFAVPALVLDDAFQHRTVEKDLEIVMLSGEAPWGNGHLFPRGSLREPVEVLARAHLIVVTGDADDRTLQTIRKRVKTQNPDGDVVTARDEPVECWKLQSGEAVGLTNLRGVHLYAFAGIARPPNFVRTLDELGVSLKGFTAFPDHHWYRAEELETLARAARSAGATA
ncbi:MAG: tetraacyldisaccharide 4'-kinase, partial [Candidatus Methylomirabilia bacterium]